VKIHFESEDVVVVEKPAGYLSVPSSLGKKDSRPVAGILAQNQVGPLFPVHRLDYEVAGLLIFAKNEKAQTILHKIWESEDGVKKTYKALSVGQSFDHWPANISGAERAWSVKEVSGTWESLIAQGKKRSFIADYGKPSLTYYHYHQDGVWDLQPITGRRHQLRLEMSRHGFPIIGDTLYGGLKKPDHKDEIALVAYKIQFHNKLNLQLPDSFEMGWNWLEWKEKFNP